MLANLEFSVSPSAPRVSRSSGAMAVLIILSAFGALFAVLGGLRFFKSVIDAQTEATKLWTSSASESSVEQFYQIQKQQLELRLNELALEENLDDLVLDNYKLRISQYSAEIDTHQKKKLEFEKDAQNWEQQRDKASRRFRSFFLSAVGFVFAILIAALRFSVSFKGILLVSLLLTLGSLGVFLNALILFWR